MIYLENITDQQQMWIPKQIESSGPLSFKAYSTVNLQGFVLPAEDISSSQLYYEFRISLPENLNIGEYAYTLSDNDKVVASGLLVIGETSQSVEYYEEFAAYEQYENE